MSKSSASSAVVNAKEYYDSSDADEFYYRVWGGEDIHVGTYSQPDEPILDASRRTVARMADKLERFGAGTRILDIGAGYGGSARYLAKEKGFQAVCLNLSEIQNKRNREMNREQGLDGKIDVVDGNFEELPFEDASFDAVWSQDAILHSSNRLRVFREVDRVLRPGGTFIFTDPMQVEGADPEVIAPVLKRINLESLGSPEAYSKYAEEFGWETVAVDLQPDQLVAHYSAVLRTLQSRLDELSQWCSEDYLERMQNGLRRWIEAGSQDALTWGVFEFRKPE